jgi:hypothetical protein
MEIYPYDGTPPPSGILMERGFYDRNNDGVVDHATLADNATSVLPAANFRITGGFLQLRNVDDNTWFYIWMSNDPDSGEPTMNFALTPP